MKIGKISESVLERSILKAIQKNRDEVIVGSSLGCQCAILSDMGQQFFVTTSSAACFYKDIGAYAVLECMNKIAACDGEPVGITVHAMFPERARESHMKAMMGQIQGEANKHHIEIISGHTEVVGGLPRPIVSITGIGKKRVEKDNPMLYSQENDYDIPVTEIKPDMDMVLVNHVGMQGAIILAKEKREDLLTKIPAHILDEVISWEKKLSIAEVAYAIKSDVSARYYVSENGIFGALWTMVKSADVGLTVELKKLPIRQETIEICEFFQLNPYELHSGGTLLIATHNGYDLVSKLKEQNIQAQVIGKTNDTKDRVVISGEETRFLEPPKTDEIYKVLV